MRFRSRTLGEPSALFTTRVERPVDSHIFPGLCAAEEDKVDGYLRLTEPVLRAAASGGGWALDFEEQMGEGDFLLGTIDTSETWR